MLLRLVVLPRQPRSTSMSADASPLACLYSDHADQQNDLSDEAAVVAAYYVYSYVGLRANL